VARTKFYKEIKAEERELKSMLDLNRSTGDKIALWITNFLGSLTFLLCCVSLILLYFLWNMNIIPGLRPIDKYPYNGLATVLAVFAIILSVTVLIGQNRQRRMEKIREQVEFEVNVRAESEITKILEMLHTIQRKLGIDKPDDELEKMKESLDLNQLQKNLDEKGEQL
jgi:uncharacterized membrane protein